MKKRFKVLVATGLLFVGGTVGYASSSIFDYLNNTRTNFDIVFNIAKSNKDKAKELQNQINQNSQEKTALEQQIAQLKKDIEVIKTNHASEITDKNAEISNKQNEIAQKQAEVDAKQSVINDLTGQLSSTQSQLEQAENQARALSEYTDQKVDEISE